MQIREILDLPREQLEALCRGRSQTAYLGGQSTLCRVLGKYMMYVDTSDLSLAPHLMLNGFWESWITQAMAKLPEDINCVDVGANHGYFTLVMAELCKGKVYAFEPQEGLARLLQKSVEVNGFADNVRVLELAVGSKAGFVSIAPPEGFPEHLGSAYCSPENTRSSGTNVPVVTLDDMVPEEIGFIKIDAEGYEPEIWAGMPRHLASKPTILMEFTPRSYADAEGFLNEIASCYTLREIDDSGRIVEVEHQKVLSAEGFVMLWLEKD